MDDKRIHLGNVRYGHGLKQIEHFLGVHYSTANKALKKAKGRKQKKESRMQQFKNQDLTPGRFFANPENIEKLKDAVLWPGDKVRS